MNSRNDIDAASYAYSVNMLRLLLRMELITQEEFDRISALNAEHYGVRV